MMDATTTTDEKLSTRMKGIPLRTILSAPPSYSAPEQAAPALDKFNSMRAEIRWENAEKTIVRYTFSGAWNWDDFFQILEQRDPATLGQDVDVIVDFRAVTLTPSDVILRMKDAVRMVDEHNKTIVLITNSATVTTLYHVFVTFYKSMGKRLRIVNNEAEAYALLGMTGGS